MLFFFRLACLMLTVAAALGLVPALTSAPRGAARLRPRRSGGALVMKVRVGIIGLPNVGKSTLFNALARKSLAQAANFPFCTIEPNVARLAVPDAQLGERLRAFAGVERHVSATIEWVDIAGLAKGASRGKGLGNKFLAEGLRAFLHDAFRGGAELRQVGRSERPPPPHVPTLGPAL